jgi:glycosyltransferase involved in cell wall biosynthesis
MACGAPVIASNTSNLPEVVGMAEALFDPHDPASMAERIQAALQDHLLRRRLVENGARRAAEFTWEESARLCPAPQA